MRTATRETARALRRAIGAVRYSTWAKANGLLPITVMAVLSAIREDMEPISISAKRENEVRKVLGLAPLPTESRTVRLNENQAVITRRGPAPYVTRQVRLTPEMAEELDGLLAKNGYKSFSEFFLENRERIIRDYVGWPDG
jgi:hypothetical protein